MKLRHPGRLDSTDAEPFPRVEPTDGDGVEVPLRLAPNDCTRAVPFAKPAERDPCAFMVVPARDVLLKKCCEADGASRNDDGFAAWLAAL